MKLFLLVVLSMVATSGVVAANALTLSPGSEDLFKKSDYVVIGRILSFREIPATQETEYVVRIDEMLKPLPTHGGGFHGNMTVVAQGTRNPTGMLPMREDTKFFDVGDRALLFLDFVETGKTAFDKGRFEVSPHSFTAKGNCTGSQLLHEMYGSAGLSISQNNQSGHLYTNKPVDVTFYVYNRDLISEKKDFEFAVFTPNGKLSEKRQVQLHECERSTGVSWSFIPAVQGKYTFSAIMGNNEGGGESIGGILIEDHVDSPLSQYKREGRDGIKCQTGLEILRKASNGLPACVKSETKTELVKRGWGSETWPFGSVQGGLTPPAMCVQNGGNWLEQYHECEYVSEEQCSLLGGQYEEKSSCRHSLDPNGWCTGEGIPVCTLKQESEDKSNLSTECETEFKPRALQHTVFPNGTSQTVNYIPVFLMKPNSTGKICTINWNAIQGKEYSSTVFAGIGKEYSDTSDVSIVSNPDYITIDHTNKTITYTITAPKESQGFYRIIPMFSNCNKLLPLAVGYDESHSFDDDFLWLWDVYPCPFSPTNVQITGLSGIDVVYIVKVYD